MHRALLPKYGPPLTTLEKVVQKAIKVIAWLPLYIAIITTLTLLTVIFGVPFVGGR